MRIFIGSIEIAGVGKALSRGFNELAHEAHLITSLSHPFSYGGETPRPGLLSAWQKLGDIGAKSRNRLISFCAKALSRVFASLVLAWAVFRYDAFIYLFGCTLTRTRLELILLRLLRKKIIFVYLGSDARPSYMDGFHFSGDLTPKVLRRIRRQTRKNFLKVRQQEHYADYLVNAPATALFGDRKFVNWFAVGLPTHVEHIRLEKGPFQQKAKVRILHSPSKPGGKGTAVVEQAIQNLLRKGYEIDFIQLTGVPNSKVLEEISQCDFVVDQVYSDTPMAVFATEAASMGVPSVVSGYFSEKANQYIDAEILPPSLYVMPDCLQDAIEKMISDPEFRRDLGRKAQNFIYTHWTPKRVAENYLRLLEGNVPEQWMMSPHAIDYFKGAGLSEQRLRDVILALTNAYGNEVLCLDDKPALKDKVLGFAHSK